MATYNWDIGTIQRGNNNEKKFEVPSHQWFDLTDKSGTFGVTVLQDSKNASDKPDDNTLRLTLMRTPGIGTGNGRSYADQSSQDWGHHEFVFGLAAHAGDWRQGQTDWQAWRLNQPLLAFEVPRHAGSLGTTFSLFKLNTTRVRTLAVKHAEQSDEVVVRLVELDGKPAKGVSLSFAGPITSAREITGAEQPLGPATVTAGALVTDFTPYQIRSFALKLGAARRRIHRRRRAGRRSRCHTTGRWPATTIRSAVASSTDRGEACPPKCFRATCRSAAFTLRWRAPTRSTPSWRRGRRLRCRLARSLASICWRLRTATRRRRSASATRRWT